MVGTFDLLWVGIAAGVTALYSAVAQDALGGWQGQVIVFAVASVVLIILGRTVFSKMREQVTEHPTLNKRMSSTIGARAVVVTAFSGGLGRVRMGDTVWTAESKAGSDLAVDTQVVVEATNGNVLIVKPG